MIDSLTTAIEIYAGCVTLLATVSFLLRRLRPAVLDTMVFLLEGALVVRAVLGVGEMASGRHPVPGTTHIAYLVTSVAILPVALSTLADDRSYWSTAVLAVASLAIIVIAVRLQMTWAGHA